MSGQPGRSLLARFRKSAASCLVMLLSTHSFAGEFSYENIEKRYPVSALSPKQVTYAKMQGECLVELKDLNFKKKSNFDPVALLACCFKASI